MIWLVMNIGCIECEASSNVVGVFSNKERADELAEALYKTHNWRESGHHRYEVFEIPEQDFVNPEYLQPPC